MGLKTLLFKPRWQHKNPAIRARAVAELNDSELTHQLPAIARNDAEPEVRLAALRRIDNLDTLFTVARLDKHEGVSSYCWRQVMQQLETLDSDQRARSAADVVAQIDDPQRLAQLARKARSAILRGAAQEKVTAEGLLGDIAINDPDPELRLQAAGRVSSESTLKRIADKVRRTDKKLFRALTERLQARQVAAGDTTIVADRAVAICQELEQLSRTDLDKVQRAAQFNRLSQAFASVSREAKPAADLQLRFENAARIAEATLADPVADPIAPLRAELAGFAAQASTAIAAGDLTGIQGLLRSFVELDEKLMAADPALHDELSEQLDLLTAKRNQLLAAERPDPALLKLCEQVEKPGKRGQRADFITAIRAQWQTAYGVHPRPVAANQALKQRFDQALTKLTERQSRDADKRQQAVQAFSQHLDDLEQRLEDGDLVQASQQAQQAAQALARAGKKHPESGRLGQLRGKLQEMRKWQQWANDEVRQRLLDQATAIQGSGMHPDAVAAKVKELRGQWKDLDQGERLPGDPPNRPLSPKLYREFQAALETAFEPARPFFEKRAEVQGKHFEELNALCERLATITPSGDNWEDISRAVGEARGSLRRLTEVPHKQRAPLAQRLRSEADRLDEALKGQYAVVERRKRKIIEEVAALIDEPDVNVAVAAAKSAQNRWKEAGRLRRGLDQKLWKEYRSAADQVFGRLDEQRQQVRAEQQASRQQLQALLDQAKQLDPAASDFRRQLEQLHQQWRESGASDRRMQEQFAGIVDQQENRALKVLRQKKAQGRMQLRQIAGLCHQLEQSPSKAADIEPKLRAEVGDLKLPKSLQQRCDALLVEGDGKPDSGADNNLQTLKGLCIEAEFLSGIETPEAFRDARMAYQVARLSQRMGGETSLSFNDEANELEQRWLGCGPLPLGADTEQAVARFKLALEALDAARP